MNSNTTHIIHRQRYELKVTSQQQGRQLQQQLQQFNLQYLLPELNSRLNNWFTNSNEIITIDKLEIDIGHINPNAASGEWLEKIVHQLEKKLQPIAGQKATEEIQEETISMQKTGTAIYATDAFLFFLQNGLLPQASMYTSVAAIIEVLQQISTADQAELKDKLVQLASDFALQRLAMLPADQLYFFIHLFFPELSIAEWQNWLENTVEKNKIEIANNFAQQAHSVAALFLQQQLITSLFQQIMQEENKDQNISWIKATQLVQLQTAEWLTEQLQTSGDAKKIIKPIKEFKKVITRPDKELITEEGTFITNAGICLVTPYLPMFFKALQLTDGASFLNTHSQQKAILVLHFLATGEEDASEEKLVFAKLLCGWPLQMPLTEKIILTEAEKVEVNDLLLSMIEHWQAIKSTSPDGLRQAFLQRSGKLSDKEDGFLLQVEYQSLDILLDQIPWSFHLIKLPWMKRMVTVEWF